MTNELTFVGMAAGASAYITGKFFYSTLETMADHREIQSKLEEGQELEKEDVLFLEDSVRTVKGIHGAEFN